RDQYLYPLWGEDGNHDGQSSDVPAGPCKARNVAGPYWICMSQEDDGDRGCRLFRRLHEDGGPSHDQVDLEPDQFGREFWKPSGVALGRPELNQNVLALDPAALPQA